MLLTDTIGKAKEFVESLYGKYNVKLIPAITNYNQLAVLN